MSSFEYDDIPPRGPVCVDQVHGPEINHPLWRVGVLDTGIHIYDDRWSFLE